MLSLVSEFLQGRRGRRGRRRFRVPGPERDSVAVKQNSKSLIDVSTSTGHGFRLQPFVTLAILKVSSMGTLISTLVRADTGGLDQSSTQAMGLLPSEEGHPQEGRDRMECG